MKGLRITIAFLCLIVGLTGAFAQNQPPTPTDLVAQPVPGNPATAKLTWQTPNGNWMYRVYRSAEDTAHFQMIGMTPSRSFFNNNLQAGHTYYYYVTSALLNNGTIIESPPSNVVSYTRTGNTQHPRGIIAGDVTDDSTGLPIRHAKILFFRMAVPGTWAPQVFTDSLGHYSALLDTGSYIVRAEALSNNPTTPGYIPEWYDNVMNPTQATKIAVAESSLSVANFGLGRPVPPTFALISGAVTDSAGNPVRGASVTIMRPIQTTSNAPSVLHEESASTDADGNNGIAWRGRTDSLGNYRARVISGRSYIAMASKHGYVPEYYNNKTNPIDADIIAVSGDVNGINFSLATHIIVENTISGSVRDSLGTGVPSRIVLLPFHHNHGPSGVRFGHTDSLGVYSLDHVRAGTYLVLAIPFHGYAPAFYKAGAFGVHRWQDADSVNVSGNVTGIDVGVVQITGHGLANIRGQILATDGQPVEGVSVYALSQNRVLGFTITDASGAYNISALPAIAVNIVADRNGYNSSETTVAISQPTQTVDNVNLTLSNTSELGEDQPAGTPTLFALYQNYPNPFNPSTTIGFSLPVNSTVTLKVYNLIGQEIAVLANGPFAAGQQTIVWNGKDLSGRTASSGLYFYRLRATSSIDGQVFNQMRKMMLVK